MAELKTQKNSASVHDFLAAVMPEEKRKDSKTLLALFEKVTGEKAQMWGSSIVGFGQYHYKSERSKQEGDWPRTGFSPRKTALTVYIMPGVSAFPDLLKKLGKYTTGSSCLYIKRLSDIDILVLEQIIQAGLEEMSKRYPA